ncbi:MAG TPA: adenylyltransferase/cytidyltransferase family protein [Candidatus Microsaccharimonas sp.]
MIHYRKMAAGESENILLPKAIFTSFSDSDYGQSLAGKPRWDRQRPEHVADNEWIELLGRDADNLEHMRLTYQMTNLFIKFDDGSLNINSEEADLLRVAAMTHDMGKSSDQEGTIGGDINYELKTSTQTENERQLFSKIFDELAPGTDVKTKFIIESIIFKRESKLGLIFDAIEKLGYIRTAKNAFEQSKQTDDAVLKSNLQWLSAGVLANQTIPLMEYSANYTPVRKYLQYIAPFIDEAFSTINPQTFDAHDQPENEKRNWFRQSKVVWRRGFTHAKELQTTSDRSLFSQNPNFDTRFVEKYEDLAEKVAACKKLGLKIVLTSGSFDLMHIGHMRYVEKAKEYGDILVVGVDSDEKIRKRKGPDRPIVEEKERMQMLSHTRGVDLITLKNPTDPKWELIRIVHPDILIATAETYTSDEITQLEAGYCERVVVLEPQATTSTSARIRRLNISTLRTIMQPIIGDVEAGMPHEALKEKMKDALGKS